jgi:pimeloyl-ACP methyl ester carboxylesterase
MTAQPAMVRRDDSELAVIDHGGRGPAVILLHGLAGSSRELLPTADALTDSFHVLLMDQRGHGRSTRRPADLSRQAFVNDVVAVIDQRLQGQQVTLVGQSMGAHTAFLTAAARPDLVSRLVMLEGHPGGGRPEEATELGDFLASWPTPFATAEEARRFLGDSQLSDAWIADLERIPAGLRPRFDADVMRVVLASVRQPRWTEWEALDVPTLAVFAEHGMFTKDHKTELFRRRPGTRGAELPDAGHDAHLDAFGAWIETLRGYLIDTGT